MITLQAIDLRFGGRPIFDQITATILAGDRIGLVGSNGAGKTTLLKTLAGQQILDGGVIVAGKSTRIGYLPQDGLLAHGKTLFEEVESAAADIIALQKEQLALEAALQTAALDEQKKLLEKISDLDDALLIAEADLLPTKIESILLGLGFKREDKNRLTETFSGGWQMRIALAKLLLAKPHLLLLDEPTNHLDLPSQRWLEKFLSQYEGAIILVSHDQAFMDILCNRIFELSRGQLTAYTGNYTDYEDQKVERHLALEASQKSQQKQIEKTQAFIDRFRSKASKAAQVQSRIKALAKIERVEIEDAESTIGFTFPATRATGQQVITLEKIDYGFNETLLFKSLTVTLQKGEKVGIVGPNGAGKTTFLKILAGELLPLAGHRQLGLNVDLAYFAQHQAEALDPTKNVLDTVSESLKYGSKINPRTVLGSLLFRSEDVFKPVKVLSGGEKNRLALAKILLQGSNFLLLDEPTNHLDIYSKKVLQQAIIDFPGAAVIVSHDRAFLDPIVSCVWEIRDQKIHIFHGNVSAYVAWYDSQEAASKANVKKPLETSHQISIHTQTKAYKKSKQQAEEKLKKLEAQIHKLEADQRHFEQLLADPEFFKKDPQKAHALALSHADCLKQLEAAWDGWSQAQENFNETFLLD